MVSVPATVYQCARLAALEMPHVFSEDVCQGNIEARIVGSLAANQS